MLPLLIAATLMPFGVALAQDDGCRRCDHRGMVACGEHPEYEVGVLYCNVAAACELCGGSLLVDCKYCDGGCNLQWRTDRNGRPDRPGGRRRIRRD